MKSLRGVFEKLWPQITISLLCMCIILYMTSCHQYESDKMLKNENTMLWPAASITIKGV